MSTGSILMTRFDIVTSVLVVIMAAALAVFLRWIIRSFRRWPPTDSERHSWIWARRGGGDM